MEFNLRTEKELAECARALILADFATYRSIADLAIKAGTNPFKLKKAFKKFYGVSIFQFSRTERINKAKELLGQTNYTLQTIAELVGYSEGNNFQNAFKAVVGCPPGEWRKKASSE